MEKDKFVVISPVYLANSILKEARGKNIKINLEKLNNLIYLIYTDYFYHTQNKLFNEQFSLTEKGPVLPSVYFKFNCYGYEEIKNYASDSKGNIYTAHNDMLDSIINYNLNLHGYSFVNELIEITKERSNVRQNFYNNKDISSDGKKTHIEKQKVYTLQLKRVENKKRS